jgi:cytochrome c553
MHDHWLFAFRALNGAIAGEVDEAQTAAKLLADLPTVKRAEPWQGFMTAMTSKANVLSGAKTSGEAATALADLSTTCAACHIGTGNGPDTSGGMGGVEWIPDTHMDRHYSGVYAMWMGLVAPSDSLYLEGAKLLSDQDPGTAVTGATTPADSTNLDEQLHRFAEEGAAAATMVDRATAFGKVVGVCSECHATNPPK